MDSYIIILLVDGLRYDFVVDESSFSYYIRYFGKKYAELISDDGNNMILLRNGVPVIFTKTLTESDYRAIRDFTSRNDSW